MFAIARTAGWVAHWLEQHEDAETKIGRPRQVYTGAAQRDYVAARQALSRQSDAVQRADPGPGRVRRRGCIVAPRLFSLRHRSVITGSSSNSSSAASVARCIGFSLMRSSGA